jgi:hypothetical protein
MMRCSGNCRRGLRSLAFPSLTPITFFASSWDCLRFLALRINQVGKDKMNSEVLFLDSWETPATSYAQRTIGDMRIDRVMYGRGVYHMWGIDGYRFFHPRKPIPVTRLQQMKKGRWRDWMVDDPPHWRAMQIYAQQAKGKVLTSGLGLGLVAHELVKNPQVETVTVVEQSPDVIQLVGEYLPAGVKVVKGDFYTFIDSEPTAWNTIIIDLWVAGNVKEKMRLYYQEAVPLYAKLRLQYPEAVLVFHGFVTLGDIRVSSLKAQGQNDG